MEVVGIDVHVHLRDQAALDARGAARTQQMANYFGRAPTPVSVDEMADQYRERKMMAVIMNGTDETVTGLKPLPNDHIADAVRRHPDVFLGFAAIDPWMGQAAIDEVKRCREELGMHGIGEINPARQHFYPNDQRFYPIWEEIQKQGMPILFHGGMAAAGAGTPGGMGVKLKYTQPMLLDDVAADFPELNIICAHPTWPWTDESLAIARHKSNFYIDLSGWAPRYWPPQIAQQVNSLIQNKALFGSDWPAIPVERWLEEFNQYDWKPEVKQKIMVDNAKKLFGLEF